MNNHSEYFDNCPVGTVYETTVDYGPELVGETSVWNRIYSDWDPSPLGYYTSRSIYKYERVE